MAFKNYTTKKEEKINYEVLEKFGVISSDEKSTKELRLVSWNGRDPKYDLRSWTKDETGVEKANKGITLDAYELQNLFDILQGMDSEENTEDTEYEPEYKSEHNE